MSVDFSINAHIQGAQGQMGVPSGVAATSSGLFMGLSATVVADPMSLLASAAEELTFSVDTTDKFKLSERKEDDKALNAQEERVKLYKEMMQQVGKKQEMDQLTTQLTGATSKDEAKRQALQRFPDFSDAYAALDYALEELEKKGASPESIQAVKNARDELLAMEGPAIKAGIQAMLHAQDYGDLDTGETLRDLYRQTVCDFADVDELFAHIMDKYGQDKFDQAISFLTRTLGTDMSSDMPSMGKNHLESVNANLGLVRLLQSAHAQCDKVMERWQKVHGVSDCPLDSRALLGKILELRKEAFLSALHFERIVSEIKPPDIEREVLFLQELMHMTRSFPSQLFNGHSGHMKILEAVQGAVDNAIDREDAFLAEQN